MLLFVLVVVVLLATSGRAVAAQRDFSSADLVRDIAAELEVGAEVLATRKDVEAIAFGSGAPDDSPLMRGWRRDVVGEKLLAELG